MNKPKDNKVARWEPRGMGGKLVPVNAAGEDVDLDEKGNPVDGAKPDKKPEGDD